MNKMPETIEEVEETNRIELSSEEIDLFELSVLDQIDAHNDSEDERFLREWDHVTGYVPATRQDMG